MAEEGSGVMSDEDLDGLDGKGLRARLEAELKRNSKVTNDLRAERAMRVIRDKGFTRVKPEDFSDLDPALIESKAEELEASRAANEASVLRTALSRSGMSEDQVEEQVKALLQGNVPASTSTQENTTDAWEGARSLSQIPGARPAPDFSKMTTSEKIEYGLQHSKKS